MVPPGLEVVGHGDDLEAGLLREHRVVEQLARAELLRRGLVAELQRPRHAARSSAVSTSKASPSRSSTTAVRPAARAASSWTRALARSPKCVSSPPGGRMAT